MGFILAIALSIGLDLFVTQARLKRYGPIIELNPIARQIAQGQGVHGALAFLLLYNLALLAFCSQYPVALHILFGVKVGVNLMQIRSLEVESFVETVLRAVKKKNLAKSENPVHPEKKA